MVASAPTTADPARPPVSAPSTGLRAPVLPVALTAVAAAVFIARTAFTIDGRLTFSLFDDAMISLTYARNLAEGHGLVWNAGEPAVEGYTNLLWAVTMAVPHLLGLPDRLTSLAVMVTGAVLLCAVVAATRPLARWVLPEKPLAATLAPWLVAGYYPLAFWTLRGMEVGLVAALLVAAVLLALRLREAFTAGGLAALAGLTAAGVLTRTDVAAPLLLVAVFAVVTARAGRRVVTGVALGLGLFGTLAAHTLARVVYYGDALPNTYYLKVTGVEFGDRLLRGALGLGYLGTIHLWLVVALAVVAVAAHLRGRGLLRSDLAVWLVAGIAAGQLAYSVYVGGDAWEALGYANRYIATAAPFLLVLAAGGIDEVVAATRASAADPRRMVHLLLAAVAGLVALVVLTGAFVPAARLQLGSAGPTGLMLVVPAAAAAAFASLPVLARHTSPVVIAAGLAALTLASTSGEPLRAWVNEGAAYVADDQRMARYGTALAATTTPATDIAVVWAGALPYFAQRPAVDLLGKNDPVIAHQAPVRFPFHPGHDKWDYAYSIGELQPDVVTQLFSPSDADIEAIRSWGYRQIGERAFVREQADGVDADALAAFHAAGGGEVPVGRDEYATTGDIP